MFTDIATLFFFSAIRDYLRDELHHFVDKGLFGMAGFMGFLAMTLVTLWIMIQGYRIMTGTSKEPLMAFLINAARIMVIVFIASNGTIYNEVVRENFNNARQALSEAILGNSGDVYDQIDKNLEKLQVILTGINAITTGVDSAGSSEDTDLTLIMTASAFGTGAPAIVAGGVSLLNEIAFSLAIVFGPMFMICFLFEQTKQLFWNWVKYCIAVGASTVIISAMTAITLKISYEYAKAIIAGSFLDILLTGGGNAQSLAATAMTQGGLGLILSTLLVAVPPMVMQFFSVNLGGAVTGYTAIGGNPAISGLGGSQSGSNNPTAGGIPEQNKGTTQTQNPHNQLQQQTVIDRNTNSTDFNTVRTDSQRGLATTNNSNSYKPSDYAIVDTLRQNRADGGLIGAIGRATSKKEE